jgi:Saccharopine dehydrogenase NADP binding domain
MIKRERGPGAAPEQATVYGAYGHTGSFVVAELRQRGWTPVLSGRNRAKLAVAAQRHGGAEVRVARVEDPASLDEAISGSSVVINCAGPFVDTAVPLVEAAIRSRVHYLDVAAEQTAVLEVFDRFKASSLITDLVILPAMAFFGGLADLMATTAMDDWDVADEICIAVALDRWHPTTGTRVTGQRHPGRRFVFSDGRLERADPPPGRKWLFPAPFGLQDVAALSLAEAITISRHLRPSSIRAFMNLAPLTDLHDPETPPPVAADDRGRSSQVFLMDVIARKGGEERRVIGQGQDIYAVTAPIVVEAAERVTAGSVRTTGVVAAGEVFDASDFLASLDTCGAVRFTPPAYTAPIE